jgi:hypothetical protein
MMPWRDQLRLAWRAVRWAIWAPIPVWANVVLKIAQLMISLGAGLGSLWIVAAALVLAFAVGLAVPLP